MKRRLAIAVFVTLPAFAQDSNQTFLFWMANAEGGNANCILVHPNGNFRLEIRSANKTIQLFEGTLTPDRMTALHRLLEDDRFRQLLPEAVNSSLLPTGLNEMLISVTHDGRWLGLRFLSGVSSDRNRPLLEQFTKWENDVLRGSHRKLREESAGDNCLPAGEFELKTRPDRGP